MTSLENIQHHSECIARRIELIKTLKPKGLHQTWHDENLTWHAKQIVKLSKNLHLLVK